VQYGDREQGGADDLECFGRNCHGRNLTAPPSTRQSQIRVRNNAYLPVR
jgi:hypothetical protein